jgi:hypothetical protein
LKIDDILLRETTPYIGYQLMKTYISKFNEQDMPDAWMVDEMKRVPSKISKFCDRKKISKAWKIDEFQYFVLSTDGTMFELLY